MLSSPSFKFMTKKMITLVFWLVFFGFFFLMAVPKFIDFVKHGFPEYMGDTLMQKQLWFFLHINFGTIVYITGLIQFTPYIRNNYTKFHRKLGKVYILASLICIITLFIIVPGGLCVPCRPSNYIVTCLWLTFVLSGYFFIRQGRVIAHQRMMVSGYICAAYFVTVRIIDQFAMSFFHSITKTENQALLVSDMAVWAVPLAVFWLFWKISDIKKRKQYI